VFNAAAMIVNLYTMLPLSRFPKAGHTNAAIVNMNGMNQTKY
jgi:hypothetical protein